MTFWEEFSLVFTEIGWIPAICLLLGLIFIMIEIFQPGFGVFGIMGGVLVIVGIAFRMYHSGAGNPIIQLFVLFGICAIIIVIALLIMVWSMKRGWLSRTAFVQKSNAVSEGHSEGTRDFSALVGKYGVTTCDLHPGGIAKIDGNNYDVVSQGEFILKNTAIEVVKVEGIKIVVKQIDTNLCCNQ